VRKVVLLIASFAFVVLPTTAYASETHITWERSQLQQVEVAQDVEANLVDLTIDGQSQSLRFAKSQQVLSDGYSLYQVLIPTSFLLGDYVVRASLSDGTFKDLALIKVVEFQSHAFSPLLNPTYIGSLAITFFALLATWGISQTETNRDQFKSDQTLLDSSEGGSLGRSAKGRRKFRKGLIASTYLDQIRSVWTITSARISPLFSRVISDGGYLQYSLGALVLLFPLGGILLGAIAFQDISGYGGITVPSFQTLVAILVLAALDASVGFLAAITFGICALTSHRFENIYDVRLYLGLAILFFAPSFIANATRGLRKSIKDSDPWERFTDVIVGSTITGWAIFNAVNALNGLAHLKLPITKHAAHIGLIVGFTIAIRYLVEEYVNGRNHYYLSFLSPKNVHEQNSNFRLIGWFIKSLLFLFFAVSFLGLSWHIWAGLILMLFPNIVKTFKESFPNSPTLFQILPVGVPALVFMTLLGKIYSPYINSLQFDPSTSSRTIFILAAIPGFVIGFLKFFGREAADGDVRWYMRPRNKALYRTGGVMLLATYIGLTIGWIG
jgi:hypothetical protein